MAADQSMGKKQSNFSVTCNLLRQYLKEKASLGLESVASRPLEHRQFIHGENKKPTTMNLLPGVNASDIDETEVNMMNQITAPKSMDLFPRQTAGFDEDQSSKASNIEKFAPLTIFYGGKVLVFEGFPVEKAKGLMQMAGKEASAAAAAAAAPPSSSLLIKAASGLQQTAENGLVKPSTNRATASDMPIARRNSLHRFLEKRKDRVTARAPYQVGGGSAAVAPEKRKAMQKDAKSWLGLGREVFTPQESLESRR